MEETLGSIRPHRITIQDRKTAGITGVSDCVSFDENEVVLDTDMGLLTIRGKDLHVNRLTLEKGEVDLDGTVESFAYSSNEALRRSGESLFARLFKWGQMSERIRYELLLTGLSLVMGGWLMIVYDSLRLLRLLIHHNSLFMGMEDFFYWIYAGGAVFMLLYEQNDGSFRFYAVAGVFLGMAAYDRFVSRIFFRCLKKFSRWLKITRKDNSGS